MEIILIRHGKPVSATNERCDAVEFAQWIKRYKYADISLDSRPNWQKISAFDDFHLVSSALPRAQASAEIAFGRKPSETYGCLNEMDIPYYRLPFNLKAWTWVYLNRALWMLGLKGKFESYTAAKSRARKATELLISQAQKHQTVVSFGHGYMNLHIRRYLAKQGWSVVQHDNSYWGVSQLVFTPQ